MRSTVHFLIPVLIALLLAGSATWAQQGHDEMFAMNFNDAEIEGVVKQISEFTGKSFIIDEKVRGKKITVISPLRLDKEEAWEVFKAILNVKGFAVIPSGKVYKIVASQDAKKSNIETLDGPATEGGDRFVTRMVPLKSVDVETASKTLEPLRSEFSAIITYQPTNTLIITDTYNNIERLLTIIDAIDVETVGVSLEIIPLKYAAAATVAKTLTEAVTEQQGRARATPARRTPAGAKGQAAAAAVQVGAQTTTKIIPDERTNSLIVITDTETLKEIMTLVNALDTEIPSGTGKIHVLHLKYADSESVATVLNAITASAAAKVRPNQPIAPKSGNVGAVRATGGEVLVKFDEDVNITADKATNSLVIVASPQDFQTLKEVVDRLDVRRPQVLVEALILEMSYDRAMELGVEWRTTTDARSDEFNVIGGTNFGDMASLASLTTNPLAGPAGLFLAAIDGTVEVGGVTFPNVGALVSALEAKGDVNVLSSPHLLTTDNEEAEIIVSDNIPFQTSEKFDSNGNPIFTFEYRDVGLTLRFTPQINDDDFVKLKLFQEISDVVDTATGGNVNAPSTTKRSTKTTVVARDGSTVVIGGLVQDDRQVVVTTVPCLGDLPILGVLFRKKVTAKDKTNLMVFLTPHIVRDTKDMQDVTRRKRDEYEYFIKNKHEEDDESIFQRSYDYLMNKPEEVDNYQRTRKELGEFNINGQEGASPEGEAIPVEEPIVEPPSGKTKEGE